jgi:hypothetical protein
MKIFEIDFHLLPDYRGRMDNLFAVLIIVAAAAYLIRRWIKPSKKAGGGCPGCSGCGELMAKAECGHDQARVKEEGP